MAIYHFSVKTISRGAGRSAVACSAYRSAEKLEDRKQQIIQDYTRKTGVEFKNIYAPIETNRELLDRQTLWNKVEQVEKRKDATLAREFEIAFPCELSKNERERLLDDLCSKIVKKHNVIVDAVIHAPHTKSGSDERNYHAHIMFTSRHIDKDTGEFATKKNRDFNKERSSETVNAWRKDFADLANLYLISKGVQVDHRSYKDQGSNLEATQHEGNKVTALRREGKHTEVSLSNDAVKERNAEKIENEQIIKGLDQEILIHEQSLQSVKYKKEQLKNQLEQPQPTAPTQKNIEPRPQATPQIAVIDNMRTAQTVIHDFKTLLEKTQKNIFDKETAQEITNAKVWLAKIDEMKAKTPMFLGKKAHLAKIDNEVAQYEKMRLSHEAKRSTGITPEHKKIAKEYINQHHKNEVERFKQALIFTQKAEIKRYREIFDPRIDLIAKQDQAYTGKIIRADNGGMLQETHQGTVFHKYKLANIQIGKSYTLEQKSDTNVVNVQQDYEIRTRKSMSKDRENDPKKENDQGR